MNCLECLACKLTVAVIQARVSGGRSEQTYVYPACGLSSNPALNQVELAGAQLAWRTHSYVVRTIREFPKIRGTYLGSIIRILLFRVLYQGPLFSETPIRQLIYVYAKCREPRLFSSSFAQLASKSLS